MNFIQLKSDNEKSGKVKRYKYLELYNDFLEISFHEYKTLTIHRTAGKGRGPSFIPLYPPAHDH